MLVERTIKLNKSELSCLYHKGSGDQSILFLHGLGCSKESFSSGFEGNYFPDDITLLAPDMLGHGASSKPDDFSYQLEEQSNIIDKLLQHLGCNNINIVAHSMGNVVAILLAEKLDTIKHIFCLEGNLISEDCTISRSVSKIKEIIFVNKIFPIAPQNFRCRSLASDPAASPIAFHRSAKSLVDWSDNGGLLDKFININVKKTYIFGEENKEAPIIEKLKDIDIVEINGCGHFMMMDKPDDTYKAIANRL